MVRLIPSQLVVPLACCFTLIAAADDAAPTGGIKLVDPTTQKWEVGLVISAAQGPVVGLRVAAPVPDEWPEQQVELVEKKVSANVRRLSERTLGGGAKQIVVDIPRLAAGETATALLKFEIVKSDVAKPADSSELVLAVRPPRDVRPPLAPSPFIQSTDRKIKTLAPTIIADRDSAWEQVEAIFDWVRANVEYRDSPQIKGALAGLRDGHGDCEELTSLFIALCRANRIPARTVWVPGHCYPEFYLKDKQGNGHWFPCQAAGDRHFGSMPEKRIILQKGDNFKVPEQRQRQHYAGVVISTRSRVQPQIEYVARPVK